MPAYVVFVFAINADFIVKDGVKAHVFQVGDLLNLAEIGGAIGIAQGWRIARPDPNICSQKCGKGCVGADASIVTVSVTCCAKEKALQIMRGD